MKTKFKIILLMLFTLIFIFLLKKIFFKNNQKFIYHKASFINPNYLDPQTAYTSVEISLCNLMLDGLFEVGESLQIVPSLVANWRLNSDGLTYEFEIKKNIFFHDGTKLTIYDVYHSLSKLILKENPNYLRYSRIKNIEIVNDSKLLIKLSKSYPPFISLLAAPAAKIYKEKKSLLFPIGTGPFYFDFKQNNIIYLKKFNLYHRQLPKIDQINYIEISDKFAKVLLEKGELDDTTLNPTITNVNYMKKKFDLFQFNTASTWLLSLNIQSYPLNNLNFRKCLLKNFDNVDFIHKFSLNHVPATGIIPPSLMGFQIFNKNNIIKNLNCSNFNILKPIVIDIPKELEYSIEMCKSFKYYFSHLNIKIFCNIIKFDQIVKNIKDKKFMISFFSHMLDLPAEEYYLEPFQNGVHMNYSNHDTYEYNIMIDKLRNSSNYFERINLMRSLNKYLYDNVITINISYPKYVSYINNCILGIRPNLLGEAYFSYNDVTLIENCNERLNE